MADLAGISAVKITADTVLESRYNYGATISAGQAVYLDANDEWQLVDANASATTADVKGVAVTPGDSADRGLVAIGGSIILVGTTLTVSETYIASGTPGGIKPVGDKTTGDYVSYIGTASSTSQIDLGINATGVQAP